MLKVHLPGRPVLRGDKKYNMYEVINREGEAEVPRARVCRRMQKDEVVPGIEPGLAEDSEVGVLRIRCDSHYTIQPLEVVDGRWGF